MDEIRKVELITGCDNERWVSGEYITDSEEAFIKIEVLQDNELKAMTAARVVGNRFGAQKPVQLERGLYRIRIMRCLDPTKKPFQFTEPLYYEKMVMAGRKYPIRITAAADQMYGRKGTLVTVSSEEYTVKSHELYYMVRKADPALKKIKFWVPMQGERYFAFFVEGASPDEIDFPKNQNGCMDIEMER